MAAPCPPLPLLADTNYGTLVQADKDSAVAYAACQAKHAAAVAAYEAARQGGNAK